MAHKWNVHKQAADAILAKLGITITESDRGWVTLECESKQAGVLLDLEFKAEDGGGIALRFIPKTVEHSFTDEGNLEIEVACTTLRRYWEAASSLNALGLSYEINAG